MTGRSNEEAASLFAEMALLMELSGADRFRVLAVARVARVLEAMPKNICDIPGARSGDDLSALVALEGIGESSARRIAEWCRTGRIADLEHLREGIPPGLIAILDLPGVGPAMARSLWQNAGIVDLDGLEQAIADGRLEGIPRLGAKSIENLRQAIAERRRGAERMRLGRALPIAESIAAQVRALDGVDRVEIAGSLRRGAETIGDIDLLCVAEDGPAVARAFVTLHGVSRVLAEGPTRASVMRDEGIQVDLRIVPARAFGAALLYFTGSKQHNIALRQRAIDRGMHLNEYGLFKGPSRGAGDAQGRPVAAATEEAIYGKLDLPWIAPELREGESIAPPVPSDTLVTVEDIRADLHVHSTASDGTMDLEEIIELALARGFHTIAVTDHSRSSVQANGLDVDRLHVHVARIRALAAQCRGVHLLAGSEVDILADGRLDYDDRTLGELDVVVASPHAALRQSPDTATARLLRAVRHPRVHILGHPTGRLIGRRRGLEPDIHAIAAAAAAAGTALEVNANSLRLDLRDAHVRIALDAGALLAINTDAHATEQFDQLRYGVLTGRRGGLPADRCVNAWPARRLLAWLKDKSGEARRA